MSAIDNLTPTPDQPEISEGNQTFHQKAYALYKWMRERLAPAIVEIRDLIINSVTGAFSGTSTTSVTITDTGEVSITTEIGRSFKPGTPVRLAYVTDPLNYIDGITKTYNATTGAFVFFAQSKAGSGTYNSWSLTIIPSGGGLAGLGSNTYVGNQFVPDEAYDASGWNGNNSVPTKNSIRDKIESFISALFENADSDPNFTSNSSTKAATPQWVNNRALIKQSTAVVANGAAAYDFTGVPAGVKRINIALNLVSTNGSSPLLFQLGTSAGIESSNYTGTTLNTAATNLATSNHSTGILQDNAGGATFTRSGILTIENVSGNTWSYQGAIGNSETIRSNFISGSKTLAAALSQIRITTVNGTDLYDNASSLINVSWEF